MQPLWDRLPELAMPVTVLVGARDAKFQALGRRMVELLPAGELSSHPVATAAAGEPGRCRPG